MRGAYGRKRQGVCASARRAKDGDEGFPNESALVSAILKYFTVKGVYAFRVPVQGVMQGSGENMRFKRSPLAGFPDVCGVHRGFFFGVEAKTKTGKLSPVQVIRIIELENAHAVVRVARPADWKEVCDEILEEIHQRATLIVYPTSA